MLERLECPSLTSLELRSRIFHHPDFTPEQEEKRHLATATFADFVSRSKLSARLESFVLVGFRMKDWQVLDVLEVIPGVREVKIGEWIGYGPMVLKEPTAPIFTKYFFEELRRDVVPVGVATILVPDLKVLRIEFYRKLWDKIPELVEELGRWIEVCKV
ncbi:hypothetical protein PM082_021913 [Marasmius tenuissimus]|nr:hypothetical protein PM082_021913 [Marasmius tenuissimus]